MNNNHNCCQNHCCDLHGCKYGYEDCPVVEGIQKQAYPCEDCGLSETGYYDNEGYYTMKQGGPLEYHPAPTQTCACECKEELATLKQKVSELEQQLQALTNKKEEWTIFPPWDKPKPYG